VVTSVPPLISATAGASNLCPQNGHASKWKGKKEIYEIASVYGWFMSVTGVEVE